MKNIKQIVLEFDEMDDGSGDGTLVISDEYGRFVFCPITHTEQKERVKKILGAYKEI